MQLNHLSLTNFRNFARLDIDVPGGSVLLVGGNAQGKTSVLEAINYLAAFSSFQTTSDRQLLNFIEAKEPLAVARIVANYSMDSPDIIHSTDSDFSHQMEIRIIQEVNGKSNNSRIRKEILVDGVKSQFRNEFDRFNAVLFLPHMMRIIDGVPEDRRRYLNIAISQVVPDYANLLLDYNRSLTQRNALLKSIFEKGGSPDQLDYWDDLVCRKGAALMHSRIKTVEELESIAAVIHRELTNGNEVLRLAYLPSYDPVEEDENQIAFPFDTPVNRGGFSLDSLESGYRKKLFDIRKEEIYRGVTTIGPHRDDLRFLSNGLDLGVYGSRGQVRTALLSIKLAEMNWIHNRKNQWPVLLLDEVLVELDPERRKDLLSRLKEVEQSLFTTTDLDLFSPDFIQSAKIWNLNNGRIKIRK